MRSIVYRNTESIAFLAFHFPSKQKPLVHGLFTPLYTVLPPLFSRPLPKNCAFTVIMGGAYE